MTADLDERAAATLILWAEPYRRRMRQRRMVWCTALAGVLLAAAILGDAVHITDVLARGGSVIEAALRLLA